MINGTASPKFVFLILKFIPDNLLVIYMGICFTKLAYIFPFSHSRNISIYHVPGTVLSLEGTMLNKIDIVRVFI